MDVVLGVAVTGRVARLAMVGSPASGGQILDQYALDLSDDAMTELADTIIGTYRDVTESGNRVAATRLCLPDASAADTLRQTVARAGVQNVEVVAEAEAAAALARSVGADAALLLADDDTVSLTVVGEDEQSTSTLASVPIGAAGAAVACAAVLQHAPAAEAPIRVMLVGQRLDLDSIAAELHSTSPVEVAPDAGYAIARGAAQTADGSGFAPAAAATQMAPTLDATQMAPAAADATQMAPASDATQMAPSSAQTAEGAVGPDLAYSQEAGDEPWADEMPMEPLSEFVPEQEDEAQYTTAIAPPAPRMLLMGSAVMFVVVSFATLAVTVAINVRPAADVAAQPVPPTQANTVPGRYLPPVPHQADPVALPVSVLTPPPAAPVVPNVRNDLGPVNQAPPAAPQPAPAPPPVVVPPAPVPVPIPAPVPVPIPVPPLVPPWTPPWTFPTTPTTPPTSTTTTTTPTTTTTTTTQPTTTTTQPTTTTAPSTSTTTAPSTPTHTTPTYTPPTSVVPVTPEPTYTAPSVAEPTVPAYTPPAQTAEPAPTREAPQTTVYQQEPTYGGGSSGGSSGSGSSSDGGNSSRGRHSGETPVTTMPASP